MKVSLLRTIWAWLTIIIIVVPTTLGYITITFNTASSPTSSYPSFLTNLRNHLQGQLICQLPVTKQTATVPQRFILVQLQTSTTKSVTLAIDVLNAYVVGYNSNGVRANFLDDAPAVARNNLWVGSPRRNTGFGGSYTQLQGAAGQNRADIALGFVQLRSAIDSVIVNNPGDPVDRAVEAKFFIVAIEMISEAARFKYIENQVNVATSTGVKPDLKTQKFETSWDQISERIQRSTPLCGTISPPLQLQYPDGSIWMVNRVDQISPDMGLLKKDVNNNLLIKSVGILITVPTLFYYMIFIRRNRV